MYRGGIIIKTPDQVEQMAAAGAIEARCLKMLRSKVRAGITTDELDLAAERFITSQGAQPSSSATAVSPARSALPPTRWSSTGSRGPTRSHAET